MYSETGFVSWSAWNLEDIGQRGRPHMPFPLQMEQREGIYRIMLEGRGYEAVYACSSFKKGVLFFLILHRIPSVETLYRLNLPCILIVP